MGEHALLAPSSAPIWGECSGSVMAQMGRPNPETTQSREGTAAHWVMAEVLLNFKHPDRGPLLASDYIGKVAPNGVVIDGKMADGAQVIIDDVLLVCQKHGALQALQVEQRVYMPRIHPENWGTLDVSVFLRVDGWLFLWDYKHGHREVVAENNLQMVDYLAGLIEFFGINGDEDQRVTAVVRIVHPFAYSARGPISEWVVLLADLRAQFNHLSAMAHEALTAPRLTSGLWCRDCLAVADCPAARKSVYNLIHLVEQPFEFDNMRGSDMAVERQIIKEGIAVAKKRQEAIEDELFHRIAKGEVDSGLSLEMTYGRLAWTCPPAQAIALAAQFGVNAAVQEALTPTQTLAAAPVEVRPLLESVMETVARRSPGSLKLTPTKDTRTFRAFQPRK